MCPISTAPPECDNGGVEAFHILLWERCKPPVHLLIEKTAKALAFPIPLKHLKMKHNLLQFSALPCDVALIPSWCVSLAQDERNQNFSSMTLYVVRSKIKLTPGVNCLFRASAFFL